MRLLLDSFWRAAAYCLHPRVVALSFLPLAITVGATLGLGYFYWDAALDWTRTMLDASDLLHGFWRWLDAIGAGRLKAVVAPLLVIFTVTPAIILLSLLVVALCMTPALTGMVAARRFPALERRHGASFLHSLAWSLGSTLVALVALVVSLPFWLVPPLILLLPPLIWGWLTYRVMAFDALATHADPEERREIFRRHRGRLLLIGIACGYLGAAPSIVWASGALFAAAFIVLVPIAVWIYTLVFAFSSLWFLHFGLAALEALRAERGAPQAVTGTGGTLPLALADDPDNAPFSGRNAGRSPPDA